MAKKLFPCMVCEKLYAEMEQAEVCERSHDEPQRDPFDDDGARYADPRDYREGRE